MVRQSSSLYSLDVRERDLTAHAGESVDLGVVVNCANTGFSTSKLGQTTPVRIDR